MPLLPISTRYELFQRSKIDAVRLRAEADEAHFFDFRNCSARKRVVSVTAMRVARSRGKP